MNEYNQAELYNRVIYKGYRIKDKMINDIGMV